MAVEVPVLQFKPATPANLISVLEAQARRLVEVGVVDAKLFDDAMALVKEFVWSSDLAAIGLDRVCLVPYGARDRHTL